jgi:hypothetical protein
MVLRLVLLSVLAVGCSRAPAGERQPPAGSSTGAAALAEPRVPPALFSAAPASDFADAASIDGRTPYEQARAYEAGGQHWLARLVLEKKAFGSVGTPAEAELLAGICSEQGDEECVAACKARVGHDLALRTGAVRARIDAGEHREPDSDLARARDLVLKGQLGDARGILEGKALDGSASREEIRLLRTACQRQGDRMCVALCETKLR